jgi:hypothetical protein
MGHAPLEVLDITVGVVPEVGEPDQAADLGRVPQAGRVPQSTTRVTDPLWMVCGVVQVPVVRERVDFDDVAGHQHTSFAS